MRINLYAAITLSCVALAITLMIVGCVDTEEGNTSIHKEFHEGMDVTKFSYESHDYIMFSNNLGFQSGVMSIVHDPNCPCGAAK